MISPMISSIGVLVKSIKMQNNQMMNGAYRASITEMHEIHMHTNGTNIIPERKRLAVSFLTKNFITMGFRLCESVNS